MKKGWLLANVLALLIMLTGVAGCNNETPAEVESPAEVTPTPPPIKPSFNFIFRYGIMGKNILDTFQGTYSKDMIIDPNIVIKLSLSPEEMDRIFEKMVEIDFFDYPERFRVSVPPGETLGMQTPHSSYYFKVEYDAGTKELWWNDDITNEDEKAAKLRELIRLIKDIIESREEYQKLPRPRGGYL